MLRSSKFTPNTYRENRVNVFIVLENEVSNPDFQISLGLQPKYILTSKRILGQSYLLRERSAVRTQEQTGSHLRRPKLHLRRCQEGLENRNCFPTPLQPRRCGMGPKDQLLLEKES